MFILGQFECSVFKPSLEFVDVVVLSFDIRFDIAFIFFPRDASAKAFSSVVRSHNLS